MQKKIKLTATLGYVCARQTLAAQAHQGGGLTMHVARRLLTLLVCSVALLASAPRVWAQEQPRSGGDLRYGTFTEIPTIDPHVYTGTSGRVVNVALYDSLLAFDQKGKLVPGLATQWSSDDAKTYLFKLRRNVRFHDGQPLTAHDVKYSLERILNPSVGAAVRSNLEGIVITIVDDYTFRLQAPEPDATLPITLAQPETAIVSEAWMKTNPNVKIQANGTGPFILVDHEPKVRIVVKKNPNYWEAGLPRLDRVFFQEIPNGDARVNALRTGALDMIEFVQWKDIDSLKTQPGIQVDSAAGSFMNVWYNTSKKPFNDKRVRQALGFAVDREAVSKAALFGHGPALYGPPTALDSPYYNPEFAHAFSYDPEKAKGLLAAAGYPSGFSFELICMQGIDVYAATCQVVQAYLQKIGITVTLKPMEFARVVEAKSSGQYDAMVYGVSVKSPDPDAYSYYFAAASTYWAKGAGFSHPTVEKLLREGRSFVDLARRKPIYRELERVIIDESPWTFLNWREQAQGYKKNVRGYVHLGGGLSEVGPGIALKTMWLAQ